MGGTHKAFVIFGYNPSERYNYEWGDKTHGAKQKRENVLIYHDTQSSGFIKKAECYNSGKCKEKNDNNATRYITIVIS